MTEAVIKVKNLSKRYRIGLQSKNNDTLIESIGSIIKAPFRNLKRIKSLTTFNEKQNQSEDIIWALNDISFEVNRGEVIGIIGGNGAGKSTLLKVLAKITYPTKGKILLNGRVASLLEVGTGFHPELTGRENIYLNGTILGMKKIEIDGKLKKIIDFSEVSKFIDTPVKRYSSGMRVRLAFSVAAHLDPEILLIDEVLAVGDVEFQKKCLGKMDELSKDGRTVLFVSHNMIAIENLCHRTLVLDKGEKKYEGGVADALQFYLKVKGTEFIGEKSWDKQTTTNENHQVKLKAIRIITNDEINGRPYYDQEIEIQIDYWNIIENERRLISLHVNDQMGLILFTSGNMSSVSATYDEWCYKEYPTGLYRTKCIIPKELLNPGIHSLSLYINGLGANDNILLQKNIIYFEVQDIKSFRSEYSGKWLGAVRPKLSWETNKLE